MQAEDDPRIWLWAVGIQPGYLLMQQHDCDAIFRRVILDDVTINMVSPLWLHAVELASETTPEGNAWLVTRWHSAHYRLCRPGETLTDNGHLGRIRKAVRHSFYPLLKRAPGRSLADLWHWEKGRDLLATSFDDLDLAAWFEEARRASTAAQFWKTYSKQFKEELTAASKSLPLSAGDGDVVDPDNFAWLYRALEQWRRVQPHYALYFRHRLLVMPQLLQCAHLAFKDPLRLGLLTPEALRDLALFSQQLQVLRDDPLSWRVDGYQHLSVLLRRTLGPQRLQELLLTAGDLDELRYHRLLSLFVRCTLEESEEHAQQQRDVCWPLTFKGLACYSWGRLLGCEPSESDLRTVLPYEPVKGTPTLPLNMGHFGDFVTQLQAVQRDGWDRVTPPIQRLQSPLMIRRKPVEWQRQCDLWQEWSAWQRQIVVHLPPFASQWDVPQWRTEYKAMDEQTRQLWDTRLTMLWFSPAEAKQGCDLAQIELLLHTEFFTTSLVFPQRLVRSRVRVAQHLAKHAQITPTRLRQHMHDLCDEKGARDTLVALDTHLWSCDEILRLVKWVRQTKPARLVMTACDDVTPLDYDGHAALDLAQWHDHLAIQQRVFDQAMLQEQTDTLLSLSATQVTLVPSLNTLQRVVLDTMDGCDAAELHLVQMPSWHAPPVHPLQDDVDTQLNVKFRMAHTVVVNSVPLAQLWQRDWKRTQRTRQLFVTSVDALKACTRNELNTLFLSLGTDTLLVLAQGQKTLDSRLEWLRKRLGKSSRMPSLRYTLPYYQRVMRVDGQGEQ